LLALLYFIWTIKRSRSDDSHSLRRGILQLKRVHATTLEYHEATSATENVAAVTAAVAATVAAATITSD
jgi:hypothetical protein